LADKNQDKNLIFPSEYC